MTTTKIENDLATELRGVPAEQFVEKFHETVNGRRYKMRDQFAWGLANVPGDDYAFIQGTSLYVEGYTGDNSFMLDVKHRVTRGRGITHRQARAILNIVLNEGIKSTAAAPVSYDYDVEAGPAKPRVCGADRCNFAAHGPYAVEELSRHRQAHYKGLFDEVEPHDFIDLTQIPDGRYAVPDMRPGRNDYIFVQVSKPKRKDVRRSRKYRYGFVTYGSEWVKAGTIEVRHWHGDNKELIGEQRPGENYRGDFTSEFEMIFRDPTASMLLFGRLHCLCGRCGKTLTDRESRENGVGPECIHKFRDLGGTSVHTAATVEELTATMKSIGDQVAQDAAAAAGMPSWALRKAS